jgi:hypothetical protein
MVGSQTLADRRTREPCSPSAASAEPGEQSRPALPRRSLLLVRVPRRATAEQGAGLTDRTRGKSGAQLVLHALLGHVRTSRHHTRLRHHTRESFRLSSGALLFVDAAKPMIRDQIALNRVSTRRGRHRTRTGTAATRSFPLPAGLPSARDSTASRFGVPASKRRSKRVTIGVIGLLNPARSGTSRTRNSIAGRNYPPAAAAERGSSSTTGTPRRTGR